MSDFVPELDDLTFDQLAERARADIPRYAPDWTDHNLHDPGMTLIDLLAWIADQQIYRAGHVGARHRAAFAALLVRHPAGHVPARGLVWPDRRPPAGRLLPPRTTVLCPTHRELPVSVDHDQLYLPAAARTGVTAAEGTAIPLDGGSWTAGAGITLAFDGPLGAENGPRTIALGFDVVAPRGTAVTPADPPWGPVIYTYRTAGRGWTEVRVLRDDTGGLAATGVVLLELPAGPAGPGGSELRLRFDRGFFPLAPQIQDVAVNVLPVVQLGHEPEAAFENRATGAPDQFAALDTTGLTRPPEIRVDGEPWQRCADLGRSGPDDHHFLVRPDGILFGNGVNGQRPPAGAALDHGPLTRTRGTAGNLRAGLRWEVPVLGAGTYGHNRHALTGGLDAGGDPAAAARDVAVNRSALLTDEELADAARALPGLAVRRAEVLAGFDRRLPHRRAEGARTLVVVPPRPDGPPSYPDVIAARLRPARVLGERLIVEQPVVVTVDLRLTVTTEPGVFRIPSAVRERLAGRLSLDAWPLGRELTAADVMAIAAGVPGVADVTAVRMARAGDEPGDGPIVPPRDGLIVARYIDVKPGG